MRSPAGSGDLRLGSQYEGQTSQAVYYVPEARKQIRLVLSKYKLPPSRPLFDNTYAYIRENY